MSLPDEWTATTVHANGIALQCYRTGDGPPVVLAHGAYDDGRRWVRLGEALVEEGYEVVTYDARGHGQSDAPADGYHVDDRVADLRAVVDGLDLADPVLLGHSMGGATVARAASRHPDLARAAVLVDPEALHDLPDVDPDELAGMVRERFAGLADATVEDVVDEHYAEMDPERARRHAESSLAVDEDAMVEIAREGYPEPLAETFPDLDTRTLVLRSDRDVDVRVRDLDAADALAEGRLVHVPDAGHYVFHDAFDAAVAELRTFLRRG